MRYLKIFTGTMLYFMAIAAVFLLAAMAISLAETVTKPYASLAQAFIICATLAALATLTAAALKIAIDS